MKSCLNNRKLMALLVLDALEAREAAALKDHLRQCEACRRYWQEISNVTEELAAARPDSDLEASEFFHQRLVDKLALAQPRSLWEDLAAMVRSSARNWRVVLPAAAALVIALVAIIVTRHPAANPRPEAPAFQAVSPTSLGADLAPTIANYQWIASQSLDELDEVLTRKGNEPLPPAPLYSASSLELKDAPFE